MIYLDSNVFIFAILNTGEIGNACRKLLTKIKKGLLQASTSALTYDEVAWAVQRGAGFDSSISAGEYFFQINNLKILPVTREAAFQAQKIRSEKKFDPRDAIHAAVCFTSGISIIVSDDGIFDSLGFLKRKSVDSF